MDSCTRVLSDLGLLWRGPVLRIDREDLYLICCTLRARRLSSILSDSRAASGEIATVPPGSQRAWLANLELISMIE